MPPTAVVKDDDAIRAQKGFYIFGRDIREVPCLRSSLLLGITCGTFAGLVNFMFTSKAAMSSHVAFGSLWLAVFAYWIPCRYKYETKKAMTRNETGRQLYERAATKRDTPPEQTEEEEKQ